MTCVASSYPVAPAPAQAVRLDVTEAASAAEPIVIPPSGVRRQERRVAETRDL